MAGLRENIGRSVLRRKKKGMQRNVLVQNFDTAQSAVLLADGADREGFQVIKDCVKFLKENGIETSVYVYVAQKELPEELLFWKDYSFITRKEINWYKKPVGEAADAFFSHKADLLLDFTSAASLEIKYLVDLSPAGFKVGCFTEEDNAYDLMINLNGPCDTAILFEQFKHYISMLNPSNS